MVGLVLALSAGAASAGTSDAGEDAAYRFLAALGVTSQLEGLDEMVEAELAGLARLSESDRRVLAEPMSRTFRPAAVSRSVARGLAEASAASALEKAVRRLDAPVIAKLKVARRQARRARGSDAYHAYRQRLASEAPPAGRVELVGELMRARGGVQLAVMARVSLRKSLLAALMAAKSGRWVDEVTLAQQVRDYRDRLMARERERRRQHLLYAYRHEPGAKLERALGLYRQAPIPELVHESVTATGDALQSRRRRLIRELAREAG